MPSTTIDSLAVELSSDASKATDGLNKLLASLGRLKTATQALRSTSKTASTGVNNLTTALGKLNTASKTLNKVQTQTAKGVTRLTGYFNKLRSAVKSSNLAANTGNKSFTELYHTFKSGAGVLLRIRNAITNAIAETNAYIENVNLFDVAMGRFAENGQKYAQTVGEIMGIDPSEWMRNQGVFMTLSTGFGIAGDRAATMSTQLTQLGYDLSSLFNISYASSMQKLQSGLAGELEPLRRLGFDLSKAKLEAIALDKGITKAFQDMDQAEKAQLRYYAIMTQVTEAHGDLARTLEAPSNQLRILQAQLVQLSRSIGQIFLPTLQKVLPYVIAAVKVLREISDIIARLVGFTMPEFDYSGLEMVAGEAEDVAEEIDDATEAAKKFKNFLLGIDELNVIHKSDSNSKSGKDALGEFLDFELPTYDFLGDATEGLAGKIVEKMKEWLGITGEIDSWADLFDTKLGTILKTVGLIGTALLLWKFSTGFLKGLSTLTGLADSSLTKAIGITLLVTGLTLVWDGVKALFDDSPSNDLLGAVELAVGAALMGTGLSLLLGHGLMFSLGIGLLVGAGSLLFAEGLKMVVDDSPSNDLLGAVLAALGAALLGTALGILSGQGLTFTLGMALLFTSAALLFSGIKMQFDSSPNNDLLGEVTTALGMALSGASLGLLSGKGLAFSVGLALAFATVSLLFSGIKNLMDNNEGNNLRGALETGLGAILGGIAVKMIASKLGLTFSTQLGLAFSGFFLLFGGMELLSDASSLQDILFGFIQNALGLAGIGKLIGLTGAGLLQWTLPLSIILTLAELFINKGAVAEGVSTTVKEVTSGNYKGLAEAERQASFERTPVNPADIKGDNPVDWIINFSNAVKEEQQQYRDRVNEILNENNPANKVSTIAADMNAALPISTLPEKDNYMNKVVGEVVEAGEVAFEDLIENKKHKKALLDPNLFASGGIVDQGQMFIARENGAELVGNIGNRTAVMNNDQIVQAVSQGVYEAVTRASGNGDTTIQLVVDGEVFYSKILEKNRREIVRTGTNPMMV